MDLKAVLDTLIETNQAAASNSEKQRRLYFTGYDQAIRDIARLMGVEVELIERQKRKGQEFEAIYGKPEGGE